MTTFRSQDELEIFYRSWGDGAGRPVVLHHGFGADAEVDWVGTGTVDALVAAGRRVVALDARGHGRSDAPHDPARYGEPRMAQDVSTLLDVLGATAVDLVGYSMGAIVALLATARDRRVHRLVVGGIGAGAVELGGVDSRVLDPSVLRAALLADDPATVTDARAAGFRAFVDSIGADRSALAAHVSAVNREPLPLGSIRVPTLVLAGRDDEVAVRPHVLAEAIPGAQVQLVDGDHGQALRDPGFLAALVAFLADVPG